MTHLFIDSSKRESGTVSAPKIKFDTIAKKIDGCLSLSSAIVPYSIYQINSTNNTLVYTESLQTDSTVTISPGTYTVYTLATEIKTQMDAGTQDGRTYTVVYNLDQSTYTITISTGTFVVDSTCSFAPIIGYTSDTSGDAVESDQVVDITPVKYVLLKSNSLTTLNVKDKNNLHNTFGHENTLAKISLVGDFRDNIVYENLSRESIRPVNGNIGSSLYDFYFTDKDNNSIDFNGIPFSLVFKIH